MDNQYLLTLAEVGVSGFGLLSWLLARGWAALSFATVRTMVPWQFLCALTVAAAREAGCWRELGILPVGRPAAEGIP